MINTLLLTDLVWIPSGHEQSRLYLLQILISANVLPDTDCSSSKISNDTERANENAFTFFFFLQFEEKFLESPEDLEKLIKGNTKYL